MAIHNYRYSQWDGSQNVPDFSADDLLESMADDLLRGGDPEKALRDLMKRGFQLPDGRRFEGMKRLHQQMREYRQDVFSRYDPNGIIDRVREQLERILELERSEIDERRAGPQSSEDNGRAGESGGEAQAQSGENHPSGQESGQDSQGDLPGESATSDMQQSQSGAAGMQSAPSGQSGGQQGQSGSPPGAPNAPGHQGGQSGSQGQGGESGTSSGGDDEAFQRMLERMLHRKEEYLDELPHDNTGRIRGLREYDFLSPEAREAFEELVGGMQRDLMEQYFQGMKQGIQGMTPEAMEGIRQMVRDMNEMLEAAQRGDTGAFDRFMEQYGNYFPEGINSLDELMEHMQRQMSAMQALLDSMDPEQRAELERMMEELLRDDRLQLDLARLGQNLANMGFAPRGGDFPFRGQEAPGFGESLDMMRRLQAMQDLENAMRGGDPFAAMAGAGGNDPSEMFGPNLGGQIQAVKDMAESLLEAGYLKREGDELTLTARAVRKLGDASLREIFGRLKQDRAGGHATVRKGHGGDILQESRPYEFGDPFHVDIKSTVMNGVYRAGIGTPVQLSPNDFSIFETERSVQHATVLAIDMSRSMFLNDLFVEAKKTALALDSLIRGQFPRDALYLVGFTASAFELQQEDLPRLAENAYSLGTNYEAALALSRRLLSRHRGGNRQILFVTDGEPTACTLPNGQIYFDWPAPPFVEEAALAEAARCAKEGITINTFVLEGYLSYRDRESLRAFVQEMTAINRGRMLLTGPYHLGEQVLLDYMHGRSMKTLR
jgi:uncharacterized protein with von Willebrand factor type A (vWA) domain